MFSRQVHSLPETEKYVHTWLFEFDGQKYGYYVRSDDPKPSKLVRQHARNTIDKLKELQHA
jgi:hypothetical protein